MPVDTIIDTLDRFYCANVVTALWADAVANRISGSAVFLLGADELIETADSARAASKKLADRIADLGGAITADPRDLIDRLPAGLGFTLPDCSDALSISAEGHRQLSALTEAYQQFLNEIRGRDDLSFHLVLKLLATDTHRKADLEAVLDTKGE
jgi:ferritin-like protein